MGVVEELVPEEITVVTLRREKNMIAPEAMMTTHVMRARFSNNCEINLVRELLSRKITTKSEETINPRKIVKSRTNNVKVMIDLLSMELSCVCIVHSFVIDMEGSRIL